MSFAKNIPSSDEDFGPKPCFWGFKTLMPHAFLAEQRFYLFFIQVQGFMGKIAEIIQKLTEGKMRFSGTPVRFVGKAMRYTGDKVSFVGPYYEVFGASMATDKPVSVDNSLQEASRRKSYTITNTYVGRGAADAVDFPAGSP
jgi:hypothetical protein